MRKVRKINGLWVFSIIFNVPLKYGVLGWDRCVAWDTLYTQGVMACRGVKVGLTMVGTQGVKVGLTMVGTQGVKVGLQGCQGWLDNGWHPRRQGWLAGVSRLA